MASAGRFPPKVLASVTHLDRVAAATASDRGWRASLQEAIPDKYALEGVTGIDCADRIALCRAACCRLNVLLSPQDLAEGIIAWDARHPFFNARDQDGYCVHLVRGGCSCSRYAQRPGACRVFDCRHDRRIWLDFEQRIPNPALATPEWPAQPDLP